MRRHLPPLVFSLLFLMLLSAAPVPAADQGASAALQQQAQALVLNKDFVGAAAKLEAAIAQAPEQAALYLELCDVLETLGQDEEAQKTLQQGRKAVPAKDPLQRQLSYRAGLLAALKLGDAEAARAILQALPEGVEKSDLGGVLALLDGQPKPALGFFVQALPKTQDLNGEARIHYHAALAHHGADDLDNAMASLFNAINKATNPALIKDIERLWDKLYALQLKARPQ
jgi:thioredoxin-like negative regulator of GroEL